MPGPFLLLLFLPPGLLLCYRVPSLLIPLSPRERSHHRMIKSLIVVLGLLAQAAASPSVAPFRQRPLARERAVTLRGGLGKEAPSRQVTAPFAALVATHGIVVAGYGGGTLGLGAGSTLVACAVASLSGAYKPYMIGVHVALLVQGAAMSKPRPVCWPRG